MSPLTPIANPSDTESQAAAFLQALAACKDTAARVSLVSMALSSPAGTRLRAEAGNWIVENLVPVSALVPESYATWRPPVRDAMLYVIEHLCTDRLAPKIVEQFELPPTTTPEARLLRLISRVPALQKLGQIISRNRHLSSPLRAALSRLENSIHDISGPEARRLLVSHLGGRLHEYEMKVSTSIVAEGSVSAILRFTWLDPDTHTRQRGIAKILKPWVAEYFHEDLNILEALSEFFAKHEQYKVGRGIIPDTFRKVRRHLVHEIDFPGEQRALVEAADIYSLESIVRVPTLIAPLCSPMVTAMTEERGVNVARAKGLSPAKRTAIAEQLVDALVLTPLLSKRDNALFHADPHPGNLLYDGRDNKLALIDWALSEHLSLERRRQLLKLFVAISLRDPHGTFLAIQSLAENRRAFARDAATVRTRIRNFIAELPVTHIPDALDPMLLLEEIAKLGVRFPSPLILFSKVLFTLSGVLDDLKRPEERSIASILRKVTVRASLIRRTFASPLRIQDWASFPVPAAFFLARTVVAAEEAFVNWALVPRSTE